MELDTLVVEGGRKITGTVRVGGSPEVPDRLFRHKNEQGHRDVHRAS